MDVPRKENASIPTNDPSTRSGYDTTTTPLRQDTPWFTVRSSGRGKEDPEEQRAIKAPLDRSRAYKAYPSAPEECRASSARVETLSCCDFEDAMDGKFIEISLFLQAIKRRARLKPAQISNLFWGMSTLGGDNKSYNNNRRRRIAKGNIELAYA